MIVIQYIIQHLTFSYFIAVVLLLLFVFYLKTLWYQILQCKQFYSVWREQKENIGLNSLIIIDSWLKMNFKRELMSFMIQWNSLPQICQSFSAECWDRSWPHSPAVFCLSSCCIWGFVDQQWKTSLLQCQEGSCQKTGSRCGKLAPAASGQL